METGTQAGNEPGTSRSAGARAAVGMEEGKGGEGEGVDEEG